ncbi:X-ray repair cross-complementing protein 5 [Podochytrium sp. JEL0797]|nr:X-ray repair cross-complementing protein 5 [Podochytrium sp. JEL0797]
MANKAATVLLLDVSKSMWRTRDAQGKTPLDEALRAVEHILHTKIVAGRKTDLVSLVLVGSDDTDNALDIAHISTYSPLEMPTLETLRFVAEGAVKGHGTGDLIDGTMVAHNLLKTHCKHLKWNKLIYIVSDFCSPINSENNENIVASTREYGVTVNLIGFGFGNESPPLSDTSLRAQNERFMREFSKSTGGETFTAEEAITLLTALRHKEVRPTTLVRCNMTLGDPDADAEKSLCFPVWAYKKIMEAKLPSGKKWSRVAGTEGVDVADQMFRGDVVTERTYKVKDPAFEEGGDAADADAVMDGIELNKDDLIRAYKYGKDLIPFSEEDKEAMKLRTIQGFSILGFIKDTDVSRDLFINDSIHIIPSQTCTPTQTRLFEILTLSLKTKNMYALVRYVWRTDSPPKIGVLIPHVGKRLWCVWNQLPFKEDVREYSFTTLAPLLLDSVGVEGSETAYRESSSATLAASALTQGGLSQTGDSKRKKLGHRVVSTAEADDRIDKFIDAMDLMHAVEDDGETKEAYKTEDVFNPGYQRIWQCIAHRALNPEAKDLPEMDPRFTAGVMPMVEVLERGKRALEEVKAAFEITKVEIDKEDNRKRFKKGVDNAKDIERTVLNAAAAASSSTTTTTSFDTMSTNAITSVGTADPVSDFKTLLARTTDVATQPAIMSQLSSRIVSFIKESIGPQYYPKAFSCIVAFRQESIRLETCTAFNTFMVSLKSTCAAESRLMPFWELLKKENDSGGAAVGLIKGKEVSEGGVSVDEAVRFFAAEEEAEVQASAEVVEEVDEQDLLDMLD